MEFPQFLYILIFSNILALTTEFVSEYNSVISTAGEKLTELFITIAFIKDVSGLVSWLSCSLDSLSDPIS